MSGQWTIVRPVNKPIIHIRDENGVLVCVCDDRNAQAISALPELLAACELVRLWMLGGQPGPHSDSVVLEQVTAAINKAKGE